MTQPSPLPHVDKCALISEPYCCSVATKEAKKRIKLYPLLLEAIENFIGKLGDKSDITTEIKELQQVLKEARGVNPKEISQSK